MPGSPFPLFDYSMEDLYSYISPSTFVDILTCLLLEHQVMLLSKGQSFIHFSRRESGLVAVIVRLTLREPVIISRMAV